jgi:hypothetical protein
MGSGASAIGSGEGTEIDATTAQNLAGEQWDETKFNELAVDGKVTSEQWNECVLKYKLGVAMGKKKLVDAEIVAETKRKQQEVDSKLKKVEDEGGEQWVEVFDPQSETYYYRGTITGEIEWEKPDE